MKFPKLTEEEIRKANAAGLRHRDGSDYWSYYTPTLTVAYQLGLKGIDIAKSPIVKGWRFGNPRESFISRNHADDRCEYGLSIAGIYDDGKDYSAQNWWYGSNGKKVDVTGILLPITGSDGEPLILSTDAESWE